MSATYPHDRTPPHGAPVNPVTPAEEPFVPRYARTKKSGGGRSGRKIKSWMILAPVGALVLGGAAVMMLMNGRDDTAAPLAEPAATAPVLPAVPRTDTAAAPRVETPAPTVAPQPYAPTASPTATLNTTPANPTPAPAQPREPTIVVQPLG
jgi:Meckel syndrome type 1 protein